MTTAPPTVALVPRTVLPPGVDPSLAQGAAQARQLVQEEPDTILLAKSPDEMRTHQDRLLAFFQAKHAQAVQEHDDAQANLQAAMGASLEPGRFKAALKRARNRLEFYAKALGLTELGYVLVPNMPADAILIRRERKPHYETDDDRPGKSGLRPQRSDNPPPGQGEWVDPVPKSDTMPFEKKDKKYDGTEHMVAMERRYPVGWDSEGVWPFESASVAVLDAVKNAKQAKLFDEICAVRTGGGTRGDPIVLGRITMKGRNWNPYAGSHHAAATLSFLIAWWIPLNEINV